MKLELVEKPTVEVRDEAAIVIFPSRPYWFSATKEVADVLEILQVGVDKQDVVLRIAQQLSVSEDEAVVTCDDMQDLLFSNGVLLVDGCSSTEAEQIEPHFQVNAVENVLVIATTQGCNLACPQCYANARKPLPNEMSTDEMKRLIDDLASMPWKNEISCVGLTGGEFFLRPDAMEIIDYVHEKGFKILVSSNGLLLTDAMIERLNGYQNLKISISLDGPDQKTHEFIRGQGTFGKTTETIRKLSSQDTFVGANMFVHQGNIDLIEETLSLADQLGVRAFNCLNLIRVGRANSSRSRRELTRIPEHVLFRKLFNILHKNLHYQEMMKNSTFANQIMGIAGGVKSHYCGIGTHRALYVRANGEIYPCPDTALPAFRLGNVRDTHLWDIWEQSPLLSQLRKLDVDTMNPTCTECDVRYFCGGGCRGENYQVTRQLQAPHFNCKEIRRTILEMMWMLTEDPTFLQDKVENLYKTVCF